MSVNILHHGRCFDGAGSAALFACFYREKFSATEQLAYRPKRHRNGDPFDPEDFDADVAVCVDFRYSQDPGLTWFFDHHRSAFQLPGDLEHFQADTSGRKFHDAAAPSCTGYIAKITKERWGFDASRFAELIHWADTIDSANFPSPHEAVSLETPAMQLAAFIQAAEGEELLTQFIEDLQLHSFDKISSASYLQEVVAPRRQQQAEDIVVIAGASTIQDGVLRYDITDEPPRVFSHFIPYHNSPAIRYAVGIYRHSDGDLRLTVGYNPWRRPSGRSVDLAQLCESYGGGGHPYVAGCSFTSDDVDRAKLVQGEMIAFLQNAKDL